MKFENELVTVTLTYGEGKTHKLHGRAGKARRQAVQATGRSTYTTTVEGAEREGLTDFIGEWVTIQNEHGGESDAPAGSRGAWGVQNADSDFTLYTEDWLARYQWDVRTDSAAVKIEPITEEGLAWIEANLTLDRRQQRFEERLEALDPSLAREFSDLADRIYREGKDGSW